MIRKILIIVVMGCLLTEQQSYSQNTTQKDSVKDILPTALPKRRRK